jgi:kinesin family protein 1/kinesin family protein 3/17
MLGDDGHPGSKQLFTLTEALQVLHFAGIIPSLNQDLFARIAAAKQADGREFLVIVSYLEIYNEVGIALNHSPLLFITIIDTQVVKDLLNPSDKQLMIREHPEMGIYVQDLAELVVRSADDVIKLIEQGQKVRHVAATNMNERSSRSHSCFSIKIEQKLKERIGDKVSPS